MSDSAGYYWRIGAGVQPGVWESAEELMRQARLAERHAWTGNTYGVSATTKETSGCDKVIRSALELHFRVLDTPTIMNPDHKTIELPKPVSDAVAELFNSLFDRARPDCGAGQ